MRIQYRAQALGDIDEIKSYLEQRSVSGAANVVRAIYAGIQLIAERPYASRQSNDPEIRVKALPRYSYIIFYAIIDDAIVEIIHVRHTSRRPWRE
jgi:plasmid stabilization system protein ParE